MNGVQEPGGQGVERRLLLFAALSILVVLAWQYLFPPPVPEPGAEPPPAEVTETVEPGRPGASDAAPEERAGTGAAAEAPQRESRPLAAEQVEHLEVENSVFLVRLTNQGGRVESWRLKEYMDPEGGPLELVPGFDRLTNQLPLAFDLDDPGLSRLLNEALFRVERKTTGSPVAPAQEVIFRWADGTGIEAEKRLVFAADGYLVQVRAEVTDRGRRLPVRLTWGPGFRAQEGAGNGTRFHYGGQAVRYERGNVIRLAPKKVDEEIRTGVVDGLKWAGLEEQYFAALWLPEASRGSVVIRPLEVPVLGEDGAPEEDESQRALVVGVGPETGRADLFVGPKQYKLLKSLGHDLDRVIWFSSNGFIYVFAKYVFLALLWIHDHVVPNYGLAIILLTLALRIVFFPLNQFSMVRMKQTQEQMQKIQPKIKAIQAKYRKKKDAQSRAQMNQEVMALYKKEGVNPMGGVSGCLPMLIQFPILIAFYNVLTVAVELRGAPFFGWIQDLSAKDPYYITPILMGVTMFLQQKMSMAKIGDPAQQRIMMMMPVIFTVMFLNLPSGLVLYWFVNNLLGIAQQWLVNRHVLKTRHATQRA